MKDKMLLEKELKAIVLNHLYLKGKVTDKTTIINELSIDSFSRRADLVILEKNKMCVFEIKSDADSLYRLSGQLENYLNYFDKVIIATTKKHTSNILKSIPEQVELWEINNNKILIKKKGRMASITNKFNYLNLLKKNELLDLSRHHNENEKKIGKRSLKENLKQKLDKTPLLSIKRHTIQSLERRFHLTSNLFKKNVFLRGYVSPKDIELLSPYTFNKISFSEKNAIEELTSKNSKYESDDHLLLKLAKENKSPIFGIIPDNIKKLLGN